MPGEYNVEITLFFKYHGIKAHGDEDIVPFIVTQALNIRKKNDLGENWRQ